MGSTVNHPSLLKRAENLLTSNGQPAFKELEHEDTLTESPVSLSRSLASIRRRLGAARDATRLGRSLTLGSRKENGHHDGEAGFKNGRHIRSFSDSRSEAPSIREDVFEEHARSLVDVPVPTLLLQGTPMTKVSGKGHKNAVFRVDPDLGQIIWESKRQRIIPLEYIQELRSGSDARYYREQFQLAQEYESRWLTIIYIIDGQYKTLHVIAATQEVFHMWADTLRKLHAIRKKVMSGLCDFGTRETIWERHYWKGADKEEDDKLTFQEVEKLCRRLAINLDSEELQRLFKQADKQHRKYLDFKDFRHFFKLLKSRPEIDRLYNKLREENGGTFDFTGFEKFMLGTQESTLTLPELREIFEHYSVSSNTTSTMRTMTHESFTSFLISCHNSVYTDQHRGVTHDMTQPLSDYYISSSHNTYLVGNQLVGVSTIEGYIRALLHGCRSVELDIYADPPSSSEPMITHGGTLTSKVPLRAVCIAIFQFGFVTSPYPIIISAEMHCTLAGQEEVVKILHEVFGDMLVRKEARDKEVTIERLPSPDDLKYKILFKTKNLDLSRHQLIGVDYGTDAVMSASASDDSDMVIVAKHAGKRRRSTGRLLEPDTVKEFTDEFLKVGSTVLQRVRSVGKSPSRSPNQPTSQLPGSPPGLSNDKSLVPLPKSFTPSPRPSPMASSTPLPPPTLSSNISETPSRTKASRRRSTGRLLDPDVIRELTDEFLKMGSTVLQRARSVRRSHSRSPRHPNGQLPGSLPAPSNHNSPPESALVPLPISFTPSPHPSPTPSSYTSLPPTTPSTLFSNHPETPRTKAKMAPALLDILVYTVGVKFRGINKKEVYAPEHMFSLSETVANSLLKSPSDSRELNGNLRKRTTSPPPDGGGGGGGGGENVRFEQGRGKSGMYDLIKHCRTHLVRIYPKGMRVNSTNYEPHRYWSAGAQLVALNWQTCDLGYMINHAMFQRNGRAGYVLKPLALRSSCVNPKELLSKRTQHYLDVAVISAQQLPRAKDSSGREIIEKAMIDPFVEVFIHVPEWPALAAGADGGSRSPPSPSSPGTGTSARMIYYRTSAVKNNGFNPVWEDRLRIPFDCVGDMMDLVFVRFVVRQEDREDEESLGVYCASLGSLGRGFRHLPLHDTQLSQDLFSMLFVQISVVDA